MDIPLDKKTLASRAHMQFVLNNRLSFTFLKSEGRFNISEQKILIPVDVILKTAAASPQN